MPDTLIKISEQCCDADYYLNLGYVCAKGGTCFDLMRPIGTIYWFSLPFRLNMSLDLLLFLELVLFLFLAATSFQLFRLLHPARTLKTWNTLLWLVSLLAAGFWVYPTSFFSLSDTPATLVFCEGVFLLLLAGKTGRSSLYFTGGILLGIATLLRVAYLNPLLLALFLLALYWIGRWIMRALHKSVSASHTWKILLVFSSLLPPILQCANNYRYTGEFSFYTRAYNPDSATAMHFASVGAGYDTLHSQHGVYWSPDCRNAHGITADLASSNLGGIQCLMLNRAYFYFGSYADRTYLGNADRSYTDQGFAEIVGGVPGWYLSGVDARQNASLSPEGDQTASTLTVTGNNDDAFAQQQSLIPLLPDTYHLSFWAWSESAFTLDVRILNTRYEDDKSLTETIHASSYPLARQPRRYDIDITNLHTGYILSRFGSFDRGGSTKSGSTFHIWGAKLEPGSLIHRYTRHVGTMGKIGVHDPVMPQRYFSHTLIAFNMLAFILALFFCRAYWKSVSPALAILITSLLFALLGESLLVIPEQRFVQSCLILVWTLGLLMLSLRGHIAGNRID